MQDNRTERFRLRPIAALTVALLATVLAACNKPGDAQSSGERDNNSTATRAEQKATEIKDGVKAAANDAAQATERAANDAADKVKDAGITSAVNAKLAQDKSLSAVQINVDTVNGRVSLRGTAPDVVSRERAQILAAAVEGVVSVDNQLVVSGKG